MSNETKWLPIESAPKDRPILVYNPVTNSYVSAFCNIPRKEWPMRGWGVMDGIWYPQPTHWMPLPAPPEDV